MWVKITNTHNKMKKILLLAAFFTITVIGANAQTYPIFGQFALGMDEETFNERLDTMKAHNTVKKEEYGLTTTDYEFKLRGWTFSIYSFTLNDMNNFWYGQIKEENFNPIEYSNVNFTIDNKLASITFWSDDKSKETFGVFSDKDSPSSRDFKHKGLYVLSATKHKALINNLSQLKEVITSKFGQPVVTHPAAQSVTFAKGETMKSINSPHGTITKGVGTLYDSAVPLYEWQQGNMRIVLGVRAIIATPYITFYDSTQLNKEALDAKYANANQQPKELEW